MSSAPRVILLDSCAYFRLARSIHPLLAATFGQPPPYSLFVLDVLDDEYLTNSRLQHKFEWVSSSEYKADRWSKRYSCRGKFAQKSSEAFTFLDAYVHNCHLSLAPEDLKALAVGFVRGIPVVSDDRCLRQVAEVHAIECWLSLDLLKVMLDCKRIDCAKVKELLELWNYENDLPRGKVEVREWYEKVIGSGCPI